ncbi:uncharacterized protein [Henckelia pumila]|uniref:uncharacterized protein n=1 Tax=Henckelia pumila TaxID=405737 RepID=UPI003C6DE549
MCANFIRPVRNNRPLAREEEKLAKISIWWDIDSCPIPPNYDATTIVHNFTEALRGSDFDGELSINVFGDVVRINRDVISQLNRAGLNIIHAPVNDSDDAASYILIVDMWFWTHGNRPPANILLISGDYGVWNSLADLNSYGYNSMLAYQRTTPIVDPPIAIDIIWQWRNLLNGEPPEPIPD